MIFYYLILSIFSFVLLILAIKSRKPLSFIFYNAFLGLTTLFIFFFVKEYINITLTINTYTILSSSILGVPGVIISLFFNFLIFM